MGQCFSADHDDFNRVNENAKSRQNVWQSTGIVSLRDAKLKVASLLNAENINCLIIVISANHRVPLGSTFLSSTQELPDSVKQVARLRTLDLTNNLLSSLPHLEADTCQRLYLGRNAFSILPSLEGFTALKVLAVDHNKLSSLPDSIGTLQRLEQLNCSYNQLAALPPSLAEMTSLTQLSLCHNSLTRLPDSWSGHSSLKDFNASNNKIESIPETFQNLKCLQILNLENNRITGVPAVLFTGCTALKTLKLQGNRVTQLDLEKTEGFHVFEDRRRQKYDKSIAAQVLLGNEGLQEAANRPAM